jgi:tRNA-intron endonuclease
MRKKGYVLKTALKYGADFRVYEKGVKPGEAHARWVLFAIKEKDAIDWKEFVAKNRIAHSIKKNLLIGIVDEEGDVSYYEVSWTKP